ncbi:MAG TPA: competence/damage-inducible protein A [Gemmatimonadales bacterium]
MSQPSARDGLPLELLTIGNELLLGFTTDTNAAEIGRILSAAGVRVVRHVSVGDNAEDIRSAVREALGRTGAVLATGGLGPTRDDVTKHAVAEVFDAPLEFDPAVWTALVARFVRMGRTPPESNRAQAEVPRGGVVLPNRWGTAPGLWLEGPPGLAILLPGVPGEMRRLLEHEVVPRLAARAGGRVVRSRLVRTTGIAESALAERMGEIEVEIAPLTLAYLPGPDGVDLRLSAWQLLPQDADHRLDDAAVLLQERAGEHVYGKDDSDLAAVVLQASRARGLTLATAESCTGGLVGGRLTAIPGSSEVYLGGVVCYADELKTLLLGVEPGLLADHGAVSEPVARAMAQGALQRLGAGAAVSVTGIAGPGGGSEAKPVGTVWVGVAAGGRVEARHAVLSGDRQEIRARAAQMALYLLLRRLRQTSLSS